MKILITGKNGYIAKGLAQNLKRNDFSITTVGRQDFDLSDRIQTDKWFKKKYFDAVIHTAIEGGSRLRKDSELVLDKNLSFYYNLLNNRDCYSKFINFGSGAEIYNQNSYYGLSKKVIKESIFLKNNFYNIRIFAVFDSNELSSRFIKASILNYLRNKTIHVHSRKKMDFFYMEDLAKVVEFYLENDNAPKDFDCSYKESFNLLEIANFINNLSNHKVDILNQNNKEVDYIGNYLNLGIDYVGLEAGIKKSFSYLK